MVKFCRKAVANTIDCLDILGRFRIGLDLCAQILDMDIYGAFIPFKSGTLNPVQQFHARAEVQVLRIGNLFLVALPCECFVEYALEIKQRVAGRTFVISMANGETQGYITTPGATGYEANLSMFKPESGALLVETALSLVENLSSV